jgi:acyl-CoA dehydrogenase
MKDFGITEELEQFQQSVGRFLDRRIKPLEQQVEESDELPVEIVKDLVAEAIELGLYAYNMPSALGGPGLPMIGQVLITEEFGRTLMPFAELFRLSGTLFSAQAQQREWFVDPILRGEKRVCMGLTEPDAGSDLGAIRTNAHREGDRWVINGSKQFVSHADTADFIVVLAVTDPSAGLKDRFTSFIVEKQNPGFQVTRRFKKMGWRGYHLAAFSLDDCVVTDKAVLGSVGGGFQTAILSVNTTRIHAGARCVGMAADALNQARQWANDRKTFGRRLGEHQAILFKLADMDVEIDAARLLTYKAAAAFDRDDPGVRIAAARTKLYASEVLGRVADSAVQIFGGAGYMSDLPIERIYRDARAYRIGEGSSEMQRIQIGRSVLAGSN